ncbi:phage integrase N-terminal SAM-like domain-containing protein [Pseudarthrobacter defluvii]|uniref:phage integrase N-terminal SAM-like domain-containing protein n=1 Tax=Pseudarthrobacter defluvii TaxID=410837 RepID=UPI0027D76F8D|nr:phage integrase N-terminal SAM-like domain-containing protein [Pseudarthrobacter defluvii]
MILASNAMYREVFVAVDSAGRVLDFGAVRYLHPEDHVFTQMLTGWRNQQLSRNLSFGTIEGRERLVTRFQEFTNEYPWQWTPAHVDEFFGDLRSVKHVAQSTIRSYQAALRAFCAYAASPEYGWDRVCEQYFGTHPAQVCLNIRAFGVHPSCVRGPTARARSSGPGCR